MPDGFKVIVDSGPSEAILSGMAYQLSVPELVAFLSEEVEPYLVKRIEERFASEGDEVSGPWAPLEQSTLDVRERMGLDSGPINQRFGQMYQALTRDQDISTGEEGEAVLRIPGPDSLANPLLAAKIETAQRGAVTGWGPTPPRPVLGVSEEDAAFIDEMLLERIVRGAVAGEIGSGL